MEIDEAIHVIYFDAFTIMLQFQIDVLMAYYPTEVSLKVLMLLQWYPEELYSCLCTLSFIFCIWTCIQQITQETNTGFMSKAGSSFLKIHDTCPAY